MRVDSQQRLGDGARAAVTAMAEEAAAADGVTPLSEQSLLNLRHSDLGVDHLLICDDGGALVGYAQLDRRPGGEPSAEIVVAPAARRRGVGRVLLREVLARDPQARVWTHGDVPGATELVGSAGLGVSRELLKMARPLTSDDVFPVDLPPAYALSTYTPSDAAAWVEVNAAAFADHAEQGRMTEADLIERSREPWFDPAGFFLVHDGGGRLAAYHWTKVEPDRPRTGEVYVVGVSPAHQGLGLGRAVTAVGLRHLRDRGCDAVELYVDGHNAAAVATYTRQGFGVVARDRQWAAPAR